MALQVWLPLNGNLNNQGLSNITVTDGGATVNSNGKIGKCYYFDGTDDYINLGNLNNYFDGSPFTICFWIKSLENATRGVIFSSYALPSGSNFFCIEVNSGSVTNNSLRFDWNGNPDTHAAAGSIPYNEWVHIAIVYNGTNATQIYKNGSLINTLTMTLTSLSSTNNFYLGRDSRTGATALNGYLNDFRLYDHALSPKEIEILSRGLVVHYPLNGGGRGGDNLLKNTGDLTLWAKESGITTTWDSEKNMYKIEDSTHTNSRWGIYQDINVEANTSYTITVTLDGTACGAGFAVYDSSTSFPPAVIGTTGRQSYTLTSGANSTKARVYLYTNCGINNVAWFSLPKVEKSDHTTPWIPNSADASYSAMGYNSTTEYDVSGYGYNGTKNGTFTYDSNTARYSVSTKCSGSNYVSLTSPSAEVKTVSFWANWDSIPSGQSLLFLDYKSRIGFGLASNGIIPGLYSGNYNTFSKSALVANKWYHFVIVNTGTDYTSLGRKLYINGVEQTATSNVNVWSYSVDQTQIGKRSTTSDGFVGKMSDVRMYATALSAAQVAELYNTAVSVANNGTLMGYELVEG